MENLENTFPVVIGQEFTPHIAKTIFNLLDEDQLVKSRSVSSDWKNVVDSSTKLWTNLDLYKKAAREGKVEICQKIIQKGDKFLEELILYIFGMFKFLFLKSSHS